MIYRLIAVWFAVLVVAGCLQSNARAAGAANVAYSRAWINRTRVHAITVNLNDRTLEIAPVLAWGALGRRQSFISFLAQHQPLAQITGSYFSLSSALPIGDIVIDGRKRFEGLVGTALAIKPDNAVAMVNIPHRWRFAWPGYQYVLQGGVRLVQNSKYAVYPRAQGFRDPSLFRPATRTAIGLKRNNKLVLVAVNKPILLSQLAAIMKALGCVDAMTLDGGTSTGLAFGSEVFFTPGRTLPNVLMVRRRTVTPISTLPVLPLAVEPTVPIAAPPAIAVPPADDLPAMQAQVKDLLLSFSDVFGTVVRE